MDNNEIEFQTIANRNKYIGGIVFYIIVFYIFSSVISAFLLIYFNNSYSIDSNIFSEIVNSENYLIFLNEEYIGTVYETTINVLLKVSSYTNLITYIILILGCIYIFLFDFIKDASIFTNIEENCVSKPKETDKPLFYFVKTLILWFCIYYGISLFSNLIVGLLNNILNIDSSFNQLSIEAIMSISAIPTIISAGFLGPIVEELIFRKSIFSLFKNKKIALIVSTISFGVIHIISSLTQNYNIIELIVLTIPYITAGFIFGFIYLKTNCNIYYVTIIHMLSNLIALSILLIS